MTYILYIPQLTGKQHTVCSFPICVHIIYFQNQIELSCERYVNLNIKRQKAIILLTNIVRLQFYIHATFGHCIHLIIECVFFLFFRYTLFVIKICFVLHNAWIHNIKKIENDIQKFLYTQIAHRAKQND